MEGNNIIHPKAGLVYYKGLFNEKDLELHKNNLNHMGIELENDNMNTPLVFMEEFTNETSLGLSHILIQEYLLGAMSREKLNSLKDSILWMWNSVEGQKITKIYPGGRVEEKDITFGVHAIIDRNTKVDFRLEGNMEDGLKKSSLDDLFEFIKTIPRKETPSNADFAKYDYTNKKWFIVNTHEEIKRIIEKRNQATFGLPNNLKGRSIHEKVIPTVCNLKNMLDKLASLEGDITSFKGWEKRSYKAYKIDIIRDEILSASKTQWKDIIRKHILDHSPCDFGASCIDIYLVGYVSETYGIGKEKLFEYIKENSISEKQNSANAIWQVGKGDGVYLGILNDNGTIKDWEFIKKWIKE